MTNEAKYWILANQAAKEIGWKAETIYSQWVWETAHFTSNNLVKNNNIAGQTWYEGCGYPKGTARPKTEGGYYIKYPNAAKGYVDFIKKNNRYSKVKEGTTVDAQIDRIALAGWAVDKNYANGLKSVHHSNINKGIYSLPREGSPVYPGHIVKEGSTNTVSVQKIQKRIGVKADGVFGPKTKAAVISFQKSHHLTADGIVGPITWNALF